MCANECANGGLVRCGGDVIAKVLDCFRATHNSAVGPLGAASLSTEKNGIAGGAFVERPEDLKNVVAFAACSALAEASALAAAEHADGGGGALRDGRAGSCGSAGERELHEVFMGQLAALPAVTHQKEPQFRPAPQQTYVCTQADRDGWQGVQMLWACNGAVALGAGAGARVVATRTAPARRGKRATDMRTVFARR